MKYIVTLWLSNLEKNITSWRPVISNWADELCDKYIPGGRGRPCWTCPLGCSPLPAPPRPETPNFSKSHLKVDENHSYHSIYYRQTEDSRRIVDLHCLDLRLLVEVEDNQTYHRIYYGQTDRQKIVEVDLQLGLEVELSSLPKIY